MTFQLIFNNLVEKYNRHLVLHCFDGWLKINLKLRMFIFSYTPWTLCKFWTQCSFHHLRMFNFLSLHSLTKLAENYKKGQLKKKTWWLCCHCSHEKLHARQTVHNWRPLWSLFFMPLLFNEIFLKILTH